MIGKPLLLVVELSLKGIAFASGCFEVEYEVFHVESQLAQGVLNEAQDPTTAFRTLDYPSEHRFEGTAMFGGDLADGVAQVKNVFGDLVGFRFCDGTRVVHCWNLQGCE